MTTAQSEFWELGDGACSENGLKNNEKNIYKKKIIKSRDITLLTKVRIVKAMVFPVVMYGCESWTIKKAEC